MDLAPSGTPQASKTKVETGVRSINAAVICGSSQMSALYGLGPR